MCMSCACHVCTIVGGDWGGGGGTEEHNERFISKRNGADTSVRHSAVLCAM